MAFQVVELDANGDATDRKVWRHPFDTREEAVTRVEWVISRYLRSGYDEKQESWWAHAANGDRMRFIIEGV